MKTWQTVVWVAAVGVAWGFILFGQRRVEWSTHEIAGMAIAVPAFCLWALARLQLGKSFAIQARAKELVTHGLYAKIRNPVYVFSAIFLAGLFVFLGQPPLFLLFLILIPMQWMRIRNERRVLEEKFGDAYRAYRKQTWF